MAKARRGPIIAGGVAVVLIALAATMAIRFASSGRGAGASAPPTAGNDGPRDAIAPSSLQSESNDGGTASDSTALRPDDVTPATAPDIAQRIAQRVRFLANSGPVVTTVGGTAVGALERDVESLLRAYFTADYGAYASWVRERGGDPLANAYPGGSRAERQEKQAQFWTSLAQTIASGPVNVNGVQIRLRYASGDEVKQPDLGLGRSGYAEAPRRFAVSHDAAAARLTIVEVVIPVTNVWQDAQAPMLWAPWFAWRPDEQRWVLWRLTDYQPTQTAAPFTPTY